MGLRGIVAFCLPLRKRPGACSLVPYDGMCRGEEEGAEKGERLERACMPLRFGAVYYSAAIANHSEPFTVNHPSASLRMNQSFSPLTWHDLRFTHIGADGYRQKHRENYDRSQYRQPEISTNYSLVNQFADGCN